ncbi:MAG TPA: DNA polymerase III subunit delta [Rhodothermales bacterium]|nr:DNA polymerase III subunit delta [Rhodothermales bacterium]
MSKTGHSYEQLETAFRHGNFKPLYFLFGDESFLSGELQGLLVEHAVAPHERDFNLDVAYGAEVEVQTVLGLCASYPVMAERRVVVVRDFDKLKDNRLFTNYAGQPNPQAVVLLICSGKPNLSMHPYRALREQAVWAEFKPLHANQMPGWIQGRVRMRGFEIEPKGAQMLAEFVGNNLQAAATEIDKLITYAGGRTKLTGDDVVQAGGQTREFNVFELQRAIGEGRYTDAMKITERLLRQSSNARSEALMIVAVLTAYFTKLWKLAAAQAKGVPGQQMAARIGVSPYYVNEYVAGLRRMGSGAVREAFPALLAADYELKGGSGRDEWLIMTLLLRKLIPGRVPASLSIRSYA